MLNVRVKPSDILEQLNDYSGMNIVYMNSIYARVLYILSRGTGRHFAELNGGSWADSYHSRRQSDRHYHRHCPSVPLAATSTLSFRGISFVLEYNLLRNLISNTIQLTFLMWQVTFLERRSCICLPERNSKVWSSKHLNVREWTFTLGVSIHSWLIGALSIMEAGRWRWTTRQVEHNFPII